MFLVMPGLVPGIHVFFVPCDLGVDGRVKPGHDELLGGAAQKRQLAASPLFR